MQIIKRITFCSLILILFFSCKKEDEIPTQKLSEANMLIKIDDVGYDFQLLNDGIDNFARIESNADGTKIITINAWDPATMALGDPDELLGIMITLNAGVEGDYSYSYSDEEIDDVTISIQIPGSNIGGFPDYMSAGGEGAFFVTKIEQVGMYIEGDFQGTFKDTGLWDGETDYFALPESIIWGSFKIYRSH